MTRSIVAVCVFSLMLVSVAVSAQQKNILWDGAFWKTSPDVAAVKAEMEKGNSAVALNPSGFDATIMAINNEAPNATILFLLQQEGNGIDKITHDSRIYLHWAALRGNVEIVEYLLSKGSDTNVEDSHGYLPVAFAANGGVIKTPLYDAFFKAGVDPKKTYKDGANLLLLSIANDKDLVLTDYFVSKGMSLKDVDANGNTAFNYAAKSANIDFMKALLKKGVKYTDNALIMAAQGNRRTPTTIEVYNYLLNDLKIKPTATSKTGETVLHTLVYKQNQAEIINYFLAKGVDVNKANEDGNTALMNAASGRDVATVELLLPKVKNINAANNKGETALTFAVKSSSPEVMSALIKSGADVNTKDKDGNNLAYHLVQSYRPVPAGAPGPGASEAFKAKLKVLQEKGLDFASSQKDGSTLYHVAITKHSVELMKDLADLKIDVNAKNKEGLTVLHKAAMTSRDDETLKYLLSIGAKKDVKTEFDETAFDLAKENEYLTSKSIVVDFLK